jgi:hypothetical protein
MNDPLAVEIDMNEVDTSFPVLAETLADLRITHAEPKENSRKDGYNLVVALETVAELEDLKGKTVPAGFKLRSWLPLQSTDKETGEATTNWMRQVVSYIDAALGCSMEEKNRPTLKEGVAQLVGKTVRARIIVEDMPNGLPGNSVRNVTHPQD